MLALASALANVKGFSIKFLCDGPGFKCKKIESHEKNARQNTFNRRGMLLHIILVKLTLYVTEKCPNMKISPFYFLSKPRLN